jgi:hypothetical protein
MKERESSTKNKSIEVLKWSEKCDSILIIQNGLAKAPQNWKVLFLSRIYNILWNIFPIWMRDKTILIQNIDVMSSWQ